MVLMRVLVCALIAALLHVPAAAEDRYLDETSRLAALGKTWGLLKYYSGSAVTRRVDWDATLVEAIPRVRAAGTTEAFNAEILRMVAIADDRPRVAANAIVKRAKLDDLFRWIDDPAIFEIATSDVLKTIRYGDVPSGNKYVLATPDTRQADFSGEAPYASPAYPAVEYRLLALFRYWNMVQYFFPHRSLIDRDWNAVLASAVPRFVNAGDAEAYHLAIAALTASINDTHAFTSSATLSAHWGLRSAPIQTRFIESATVVVRVAAAYTSGADIRVGDVVTDIDGVSIAEVRAAIRPYVAGGNAGSLEYNVDQTLVRSAATRMRVGLDRSGIRIEVSLDLPLLTDAMNALNAAEDQTTYRVLVGNVGYVNMGRLQPNDVTTAMTALRNTAAIVFDVRNYPNGTIWDVMRFLNPEPRSFSSFTAPDLTMPGAFGVMMGGGVAGGSSPLGSSYPGKVLVLADERTMSHAEYTCMAFRTAPNVTIVGSPTSGADGNVSKITLPGGLTTYFTGLGVFYPDWSPTQRIGIVPDVLVRPTRAGIAAGIDEVLEAALALVR